MMRKLLSAAVVVLGCFVGHAAQAQTFDYHVYLNTDLRAVTGCTVTAADGQSMAGVDFRLTATVSGSPPTVNELRLAGCAGGSFGPGTLIGGGYPVGLNNGVALGGGAFADVIELSVSRQQVAGAMPSILVGFGAQDGNSLDDGVFTRNGEFGGPPMSIGSYQQIPSAGVIGLLLLGALLLLAAGLAMRRNGPLTKVMLLGACLVFSLAAWAANFVLDGQVDDWAGIAPLATDQAGDSPLSGTDIVAAFGVDDDPDLRFRIDVVDAENRPPLAVDDAYTVLEDQTLTVPAPGVLGNDSDPDGDPLTAQGFSAPNFGQLTTQPDGSFVFAGLADENGTATFTYFAFDGQVLSLLPATVTVTVTPVNDAPSFSASNPPAVNEDAGAQTLAGWASFSPGPANESDQTVLAYAVSAVSNAALFAAAPTVANDGTLSYTPADDANGSSQFTVTVQDNGGTANGGVDTSPPQTFTITVNPVNDAPSFLAGPDQTVLEDAGPQVVTPWATAISPGPADEAGQTVAFNVTANTNAGLFSAGPAVTPTGALSYTPAANANGTATITLVLQDNGGTANGGIDTSAPQTFSITVTPVNDAPSFTVGPDQTVLEDAGPQNVNAWATNIDDGDPEAVQGLSFEITNNTNAALFSALPTVSPTGVLSYTSAPDANGSATITLQLRDDGGTANGGIDVSAPQSFTITVTAINDAPSFTAANPPTVLEDAGPQTVAAWASFNPGPPDEAGQTVLAYQVSAIGNPALFSAPPSVAVNGTLTYTPAPDANGSSSFTVVVQDDGGTANGGVDTSAPQTFTITVTAVNDAPSFVVGPDQVVDEDAGPQTVNPWATAISAGPPDEVGQILSFQVTGNTNPALFSAAPSVSPSGVLSYTSAPNANGVATISLQLMDNGGTASGGADTSATQQFTITVNAVNDAPVNTVPGPQSVDEDGTLAFSGPAAISVADVDVGAGILNVDLSVINGILSVTAAGSATVNNNATSALQVVGTLADANATLATLSYSPNADFNGGDTLTAISNDNGNTGSGGPQTDTDTVAITVNPINDAPVNTVPAAQPVAGGARVFSVLNGNALSVFDVDADPGNLQIDLSVTLGSLSAVPTPGVTISNNGSAAITLVGQQTALNTALDGLSYSTAVVGTDTLIMLSNDLGNTGAGGPLTDTDSVTLLIDEAPSVIASNPAPGSIVGNSPLLSITFSELIDAAANYATLTCGGPNLITAGQSGSNVSVLTPTYTGPLPDGANCTLTILAASITDVDTIDPPDTMAANYVANFTVDVAPTVTATAPINGATTANNVALSVSFSEPVDATNAVTLTCGGPNLITGGASGSNVSALTPTYTAPLPAGPCTLTVIAANVSDSDSADPPDTLAANAVVNFTVDAAPALVSAIPAEGAAVGTGQVVSFTFDENVDNLGGAITLSCGGAVAGTIGGSGSATLTFTPSAPLSVGASCTATAVAAQIGDSDLFDPPQHPVADVVRNFTVDVAPTVLNTLPANGAIDVSLLGVVTYTFSEPVNFAIASFTYVCDSNPVAFTIAGDGTAIAILTPTALLPTNVPCTVTALAAGVTDVDSADPPDAMAADVAISFTTVDDQAPSVIASTPGPGDITANNVALSISFSELIDAAANYATLTCGGPNLITAGQTGSNVTVLTPTYTGPLPNGANCTLTILAANITDVDTIDPPDNMVADYVVNFTVDAAPEVTSTVPVNGATNLSTATTITVNFSELVNVAAGGITLNCGAPIAFSGGLPASNVSSIVLTPSANLPEGATCSGQVVATLVSDVDTIDPPDQMAANFNWSFTTDAAPTVTLVTPAEAAVVSSTPTISVSFSENVDLSASAFTLDCAGSIALTGVPALPATATNTITLTPTGSLPQGASCVFTVVAGEVSDSDSNDPPDTMVANFVRNFSVDAAPAVTTTVPANGASGVLPTSNFTVNFSESVNFDTAANAANTSFDLECPGGSPADFTVVTASPASSVVLNPLDSAIAGRDCILTVRAAGITDADAIDPPDTMLADFSASFSVAAIANDDAYTVTPHLTLGIGAASPQGGGVLQNDILGGGGITGFGFAPACTGTTVGNQLDAGAANGRLTLNADGSFSYEPPASAVNTTRTFCYTVTGGDTANIVFTLQNTELVWFVDAGAAGGGVGNQARPFQTLAAAAAVDTANDTIHLAFNASSYVGGITLESGERLIGAASSSDLATLSGVTPVAGSAFPALGGSAPTITCADVNCIALGTGNTLRGFNVGNAGADGSKISGTGFGTLTVGELTLSGTGRALSLTTGTLTGNFVDIDVTTGNNQGIALSAVGGTWSVTSQVSVGNVTGTAVSIINTPAGGSATFTGGLSVNKTSSGAGVNFNANLAAVNLGTVSITTGAGAALTIDNSSGTTTIAGGSLTATGGPALNSSASALAITLTGAASTTSATQGINLNGISGTVAIGNGGAISGSTGTAFQAQGTLGATSYAGAISKTSAGRLIDVTGAGAGTLTLSGNLSCVTSCGTGAGNHGLRVNGRNAGTITFSGASKTISSSAANPGVSLTGNTGATINFSGGGLAVTTTSGATFEATGGGTVTVQGTGNTLTSSTGTALNVSNTTIGAADMSFQSISSPTTSANTAIILTNTGAGAFSVTGTGVVAGSGGTIANKTVDAVQLNTTGGLVTLDRMIIEDIGTMTGAIDTRSGHDAIQGLNVNAGLSLTGTTIRRISDQAIHGGTQNAVLDIPTVWNGLTLSNVTIENTNRYHVAGSGDANNEGTVRILGIRGTVSVTNSTFSLGAQPLDLEVTAGTLNLTATNTFFDRSYKEFSSGVRASIGNHCVDVRVLAGATANVTIGDRVNAALGNNFLNCRLGSIRVVNQPGAGANTDAIIARNVFRVNDHSSGIGGDFDFPMGGTLVWNLGSGTVDTIVENNLFELVTNASGGVGQLSLIAEGGPVQALVQNNTFDRPGNAPWWVQARNSALAVMTARFANNTVIRGAFPCTTDPACGGGYFAPGLRALADANTGATMNFTMQNNVMARHDTGFDPGQTVEVRALNSGAAPTLCANFQNNQSPDGYSIEQFLGTVRTVGTGTCAAGTPSATCQAVLQNRGNQGGGGVGTTLPPFVNVLGTVTVNAVDCPVPTGAPF